MPLSAGTLNEYRIIEGQEARKELAKITGALSMSLLKKGNKRFEIHSSSTDPNNELKLTCLTDAINTALLRKIDLPPIKFYLSKDMSVRNIAFMANAEGKHDAIIILGGKYWTNQQIKESTTAGVANAVYDGTQRWFGNPKQKAFGAAMILHEMGHLMHEIASPDIFWSNKMGKTLLPSANVWGESAVKISMYCARASTSLEFIAECFAGVMCGKSYDGQVKAAYEACGGYPIPNF